MDENDFEKKEIFGIPSCYVCSSNHKKDPLIQLFYCSHCKKLFCKECLSDHYKSSFSNIENTYIKYKEISNEEIINKNISLKAGICKIIFLFLTVMIFTYLYLTAIFMMKPITTCLETILTNIIKEAFTHKIEDPDSLFNFYEMFFNRINILNFDFNLLMIMNWLGDNILYSL